MTTRSKQWYTKTSRLANSLRKVSIGPPLRRTCLEQQDHRIEGRWKSGDAELSRFCSIALGSASELQYFLLLARDLQLLRGGDHDRLAEKTTEVKRMLTSFLQKLKAAS